MRGGGGGIQKKHPEVKSLRDAKLAYLDDAGLERR